MIDMSSDASFQQFCNDFDGKLSTLRRKTTSLITADGREKQNIIYQIDNEIQDATDALENAEVEARQYDNKLKQRATQKMRTYKGEFEQIKRQYQATKNGSDVSSKEAKRERKMLVGQNNTLDASGNALDNTLAHIAEISDTGGRTYAQMQAQTEQLNGVNKNLDEMDNSLSDSKKTIMRMRRKLATSKMLFACIIIMEIGIIALIVWLRYYK